MVITSVATHITQKKVRFEMRVFVRKSGTHLWLAAMLTSLIVSGCGDDSGLTNVTEDMTQAEMDAYMKRSATASKRIADAENPEDPEL